MSLPPVCIVGAPPETPPSFFDALRAQQPRRIPRWGIRRHEVEHVNREAAGNNTPEKNPQTPGENVTSQDILNHIIRWTEWIRTRDDAGRYREIADNLAVSFVRAQSEASRTVRRTTTVRRKYVALTKSEFIDKYGAHPEDLGVPASRSSWREDFYFIKGDADDVEVLQSVADDSTHEPAAPSLHSI